MPSRFPEGLLDWAGHRAGGLRRLFYDQASRPSGSLIRTPLLDRLEQWVTSLIGGDPSAPRVVLLIGGPGNGKTEAVEACIRRLDSEAQLSGRLVAELSKSFAGGTGRAAPRLVEAKVPTVRGKTLSICIVQDASVEDPELPEETPPTLLINDLEAYALTKTDNVYLACVNRGVLDDAFGAASDSNSEQVRKLLSSVIRAVGLVADAPSCWPLAESPNVAIWPMDVESLFAMGAQNEPAPAHTLVQSAVAAADWPEFATCAAGEFCPHCNSRSLLDDDRKRGGLNKLLRWYELSSGKRWSFRDLGSLISYMLAGVPGSGDQAIANPCDGAAKLVALDRDEAKRRTPLGSQALFLLASMLYQHALFSKWTRVPVRAFRKDLKDLQLDQDATLLGLSNFLAGQGRRQIPSALESQLSTLCDLMDPALADPNDVIAISSRTTIKLREIDARFSQSVGQGLSYLSRYHSLVPLETELLKRLAKADNDLSTPAVRNLMPTAATRVQGYVREFACRLVRRSLGVQAGVARDSGLLEQFEKIVVAGDDQLMYAIVKQVENLLNSEEHFVTSLNTTFGEPWPPDARKAILVTSKQRARPRINVAEGRPGATLRFLSVGAGGTTESVPLTFEMFKSVSELSQGLLPAVLPRSVSALIDATRARLSGQIVRDEEQLEGAEIHLGLRQEVVVREMNKFVVHRPER